MADLVIPARDVAALREYLTEIDDALARPAAETDREADRDVVYGDAAEAAQSAALRLAGYLRVSLNAAQVSGPGLAAVLDDLARLQAMAGRAREVAAGEPGHERKAARYILGEE